MYIRYLLAFSCLYWVYPVHQRTVVAFTVVLSPSHSSTYRKITTTTTTTTPLSTKYVAGVGLSGVFLSGVWNHNTKCSRTCPLYCYKNDIDNDDDRNESTDSDSNEIEYRLPQLPAAVIPNTKDPLSQQQNIDPTTILSTPITSSSDTALVTRKFQLQYTCNKCETRNQHSISRLAYRKGVVIATCQGCDVQHLIADNLGFTGGLFKNSTNTIEEHMEQGQVTRVTKEVFDLERTYQTHNTFSGSIIGENGTLALE